MFPMGSGEPQQPDAQERPARAGAAAKKVRASEDASVSEAVQAMKPTWYRSAGTWAVRSLTIVLPLLFA